MLHHTAHIKNEFKKINISRDHRQINMHTFEVLSYLLGRQKLRIQVQRFGRPSDSSQS